MMVSLSSSCGSTPARLASEMASQVSIAQADEPPQRAVTKLAEITPDLLLFQIYLGDSRA
jgi:hypothetical protein